MMRCITLRITLCAFGQVCHTCKCVTCIFFALYYYLTSRNILWLCFFRAFLPDQQRAYNSASHINWWQDTQMQLTQALIIDWTLRTWEDYPPGVDYRRRALTGKDQKVADVGEEGVRPVKPNALRMKVMQNLLFQWHVRRLHGGTTLRCTAFVNYFYMQGPLMADANCNFAI